MRREIANWCWNGCAISFALAATLFGGSCMHGDDTPSTNEGGSARVAVVASALKQADITRITLTISGKTIPTPIVTDLVKTVIGGGVQWTAEVQKIPQGRQLFVAAAYGGTADSLAYRGEMEATISTGAKAQVVIILQETNPPPSLVHIAPVIDAFAVSKSMVTPLEIVDLNVSARDRNSPPEVLTYAWTATCVPGTDHGTWSAPTSATTTWTAPAAEDKICSLAVKVSNTSTSRTMSVTIALPTAPQVGSAEVYAFPNAFPVINSLQANFTTQAGQTDANLILDALDPDGDDLRYSWTSSCNGTFDFTFPSSATQPRFSFPTNVTACVITVQVFDLCTKGNCGLAGVEGARANGIDRGGVATGVVSTTNGSFSISGTVTGPVLSGVTMTLSGVDAASAVTDATGRYQFEGLTDGSYTVTPTLTNFAFNPATATVVISGGNAMNVNFASISIAALRSCQDAQKAGLPDGIYSIDPDGKGNRADVYCPTSSPYLAPVGLCQAEAGASPACRSYVGAAGYNFAGVDFSRPLQLSTSPLTLGGKIVPGNREIIRLADGSLLTSTYQWDYLNRISADGVITQIGQGLTGAFGLTQLFDGGILVGLYANPFFYGRVIDLDGVVKKNVDSVTLTFTQATSGLIWAPLHPYSKIDIFAPNLVTPEKTISLDWAGNATNRSMLQLSNGNYLLTNMPNADYSGNPTSAASLTVLGRDLVPIIFSKAPTGMILNTGGSITRADMITPWSILQLPNGQILMSDYWARKIFRYNEDLSFAEALALPSYQPYGMTLDRDGRVLVTNSANQILVITFGP